MNVSRYLLGLLVVLTQLVPSARAQTPAGTPAAPAAGAPAKPATASKPVPPPNPAALSADVLTAKAYLEDLLSRRYAKELSTLVNADDFTIGAQIDLVEVPPKLPAPPPPDTGFEDTNPIPLDLRLGTLDPDDLLKRYADPAARTLIGTFLSNYRIKEASVAVGLRDTLKPDLKAQVETWLNARVLREFGSIGKGAVTQIQRTPEAFMDRLNRFQGLAGQLLIAVAIVLGGFLWMVGRKASNARAEASAPATEAPAAAAGAGTPVATDVSGTKGDGPDAEEIKIQKEIVLYTKRLEDIGQSLTTEKESVIRSWCEAGDEGKLKVACFAEAAGRSLGRLPIPIDAVQDLSKVFQRMPELDSAEKRDLLGKAYWDLMSAVNLGSEILSKPFGYLGNMDVGPVNEALMEQNPRMKTFVTLHMPLKLRESYFKSITLDDKKALLEQASNLRAIPASEFKAIDQEFKAKLGGGDRQDMVAFDSALSRLAEALNPVEQIQLLGNMQGAGLLAFKRAIPSLAFLHEWPDDRLPLVFAAAMSNEVTAFLRVRPDLAPRVLAACPPMTAAVAEDDLKRPDTLSENDRNALLLTLTDRLKGLIANGEIDLAAIFANAAPAAGSAAGSAEGQEPDGDGQQAA